MRNTNTLKVLIFTRDISNNPEKLTIYARITVNGKLRNILDMPDSWGKADDSP
ncbi:hypothetical protein LDL77_15750 [Flagellimonas marinaquae]|uniref:hypothetical protein n=1 Tax=Flagellimonas aurea TaxID=2915619 RepID=UPI001CE0C241|nr:hypothetical protein LDL77_15750 [Allomuricauda aquimarina]